jgi:hypothetical protein
MPLGGNAHNLWSRLVQSSCRLLPTYMRYMNQVCVVIWGKRNKLSSAARRSVPVAREVGPVAQCRALTLVHRWVCCGAKAHRGHEGVYPWDID